MRGRADRSQESDRFAGWCGRSIPVDRTTIGASEQPSIRADAPGYIAMIAFLCAYLLNVAAVGPLVQAALNLVGASVGAIYLHKKNAIPSVISNLAWAAITVAGVIFSL